MGLIFRAAQFAQEAHAEQKRKYSLRPYIEHPLRVAGRVTMLADATEGMVAAAWLHDVLEDCPRFAERLIREFDETVVTLVWELTNQSKQHPGLPRGQRKAIDREYIGRASREARIIKFLDRIDNVREMDGASDKFKSLYHTETVILGQHLDKGDDPLLKSLHQELSRELVNLI